MSLPGAASKPCKVLFVCLANLCRSPMAMALARRWYAAEVEASSAGIAPSPSRMFPEALQVVQRLTGIDLSGHVPRFVLDCRPQDFDYIIAMDSPVFHRLSAMPQIPQDRLYGWEIADPCGLALDAYEQTAVQIESSLEQFLLNREMEKSAAIRKP